MDIPASYTSPQEEYEAGCEYVVSFSQPNRGIIKVSGADHTDLLHRITTNELRPLKPGHGQVNIFTNETGRIIDRVLLLKEKDATLLLTSSGNAPQIAEWIDRFVFIEEVEIDNLSTTWGVLSIIGQKATTIASNLWTAGELTDWHFSETNWQGHSIKIQKSAELYLPAFNVIGEKAVLQALTDALTETGIKPMGYQAFQSLRLESAWPEFGTDFDDTVNPHEANMLPYIDFNKGCYIGQEVIARLDTYDKVKKHLIGLKLKTDSLPEKNAIILSDETEIGNITSSVFSYGLGQNIALGYIKTKFIKENTSVIIQMEQEQIPAIQIKLPFK